jgi:hypothetical protein
MHESPEKPLNAVEGYTTPRLRLFRCTLALFGMLDAIIRRYGAYGVTGTCLGCVGDPDDPTSDDNRSWDRIGNAFAHAAYSGFTFLRLTRQPDESKCVPWNAVDKERYRAFIQHYVSPQ